ncbi:MAG TPA: 50S ribosomal protein L30, partial [Candidatus Wallbacteria bacterium]|nr:50S ribosomal protein L30 [Candidatus Wallbacteria bacterium]
RAGNKEKCLKCVDALGLKKTNSFKIHPDNPAIRGMIFKANHLLKVEEVK